MQSWLTSGNARTTRNQPFLTIGVSRVTRMICDLVYNTTLSNKMTLSLIQTRASRPWIVPREILSWAGWFLMNRVQCPRRLKFCGNALFIFIIYAQNIVWMYACAFNTRAEAMHDESGLELVPLPMVTSLWSWQYIMSLHFLSIESLWNPWTLVARVLWPEILKQTLQRDPEGNASNLCCTAGLYRTLDTG